MLSQKVSVPNLYDQVSERGLPLYGTVPTNGVIFSDTDLTAKGASFIAGGNSTGQIIKATAAASAQVSVAFSVSGAVTMGTSGAHNPSGFTQNLSGPSGTTDKLFNVTGGGAHFHTISNAWSGATDYKKFLMGMFSFAGSRTIPTGGWVFGATKPFATYNDPGTTSSYMAIAQTTGAINTTTGSSTTQSWNVVTAGSGTHAHSSQTTTTCSLSGGTGFKAQSQSQDGDHTHTVTINGTWAINNSALIQPWKSASDSSPITRGTIIGWNSTSTSLPSGWFFCDGGTYNGFTTVNFNSGKHLWPTSGSHGVLNSGTDSFTLSGFNDSTTGNQFYTPSVASHTHTLTRSSTTDMGASTYTTGTYYHLGFSWDSSYHNHVTTAPAAYTGGPSSYSVPLIIYLP